MSLSTDNEIVKQPIKRLEIPINKFNDIAIPHHLDLLRKHKNNIKKCQSVRDWDKVYMEEINATRIVKQLKQLIHEMETLRGQVLDSDIATFDKLTSKSRTSTLDAINEYLELVLNLPLINKPLTKEDESVEMPFDNHYLQMQAEEEELERQQACLQAWDYLQSDLQQLQQLFIDFNQIVHVQSESVSRIENDIVETQVNVQDGENYLKQASKYKIVAYPLAGALLGSCLGGPVGLLVGLKFGGLTAIGGGLLGFTGGTILKKKCHTDSELKLIAGPSVLENSKISSKNSNENQNKKDS
ncbi:PREDICTED: syntaxin-17 [Ceratosolen solmsi marchali]|uniref:Syntaxin-17 n=1 Tax=Ceratosolen solmsi marchali TaxID=326594 RepID=A0AAJ6YKE1_9HYME|nr:PREDICTED: syntaxin-17 [Ceratosolen solmsi marchali]